jgi:dTDP-4-amino-4,6-dideoxygalactose transaminase
MVAAIYGGQSVCAIIVVNLYGWAAYELVEIADFCRSHNLALIEDCAQSFGAKLDGRLVGTFGDAATFSFYPTKPLGGIGDGGAVWFADRENAKRAAAARNHGRVDGVQFSPGYNSRLDEVNAAVLTRRLRCHQQNIDARRKISGRYHATGLKKMSVRRRGTGVTDVYQMFVDNREQVMFKFSKIGVASRPHYDPSITGLPYVAHFECPNATWAASKVLSLPCHQGMQEEDVNRIADVIRETRTSI